MLQEGKTILVHNRFAHMYIQLEQEVCCEGFRKLRGDKKRGFALCPYCGASKREDQ